MCFAFFYFSTPVACCLLVGLFSAKSRTKLLSSDKIHRLTKLSTSGDFLFELRLNNLSSKLNVTVQPVFVSPKLEQQLKRHEIKPPIVNQQCIVYEFKCNLCAGYVGYTRGHLHERVEGHTRKSSSIYKHYNLQHNSEMPERFIEQFHLIAKCSGKFDCLVKEMLYIRMRKPTLNVQTDSIRAKVFV